MASLTTEPAMFKSKLENTIRGTYAALEALESQYVGRMGSLLYRAYEVARRGPWRQLGKYIGRDVTFADGRRSTELQHRVVAAEKIGRPLLTGEHAHHGNEVKTDNAPENLEILTKAEHTRRFAEGRLMRKSRSPAAWSLAYAVVGIGGGR